MTGYLNKQQLIGNVCGEAELRFLPNGSAVATFSVAVNHKFLKDGQPISEAEFFNVVCYSKLAENCNKFISKGISVYVEGRQHTRKWKGQDGIEHSKVELIASTVISLDKKPAATNSVSRDEDIPTPEDIPF